MTHISKEEVEYIFFFYGLIFIILTAVYFTLVKAENQRLPWIWLGLFGLTQGLHQWLNLLASYMGNSIFLAAVRVCVMAVSLLFLTEFGRAGIVNLRGKGPGRWIYVPLLALVALGGLSGWSGLNLATRYVLGVGGGIWAALALFLDFRRADPGVRYWLLAIGAATGLYALTLAVVPQASFFPASLLNFYTFHQVTGFPVQLVWGLIIILVTITTWFYSQEFCKANGNLVWATFIVFTILFYEWHAMDAACGYGQESFRCNLPYLSSITESGEITTSANSFVTRLVRILSLPRWA